MDLPVHDLPLPYVERLQERRIEDVDLVVIHCTELPDLAMARDYGERVLYADAGTGASGHWYIERDGRIHRWVPPARVANHTRGYNPRSVGIELVNTGRYPDWFRHDNQVMTEPYPEAQVAALLALLATLKVELPNLRFIAGHEDLDLAHVPASDRPDVQVPRKRDPGPMFPWARVLDASGLERLRADPPPAAR
ncbi:MAG: N-acetylmuramoyl-L-alanine amidase [Xanthomonadaceae bacterium]|jgi:N-acetylmuramoyl-L-alanine amidase|nr:N-acetylmuramoyl-L-alanine amidase [Xanthomonadaceae bacterium]